MSRVAITEFTAVLDQPLDCGCQADVGAPLVELSYTTPDDPAGTLTICRSCSTRLIRQTARGRRRRSLRAGAVRRWLTMQHASDALAALHRADLERGIDPLAVEPAAAVTPPPPSPALGLVMEPPDWGDATPIPDSTPAPAAPRPVPIPPGLEYDPAPPAPPVVLQPLYRPTFPKPDWRGEDAPR